MRKSRPRSCALKPAISISRTAISASFSASKAWRADTSIWGFAGIGVITLLLGGNFLDYDVLAQDPLLGQHIGIMLIELGVGITVSTVMLMVFYAFTDRRNYD